MAETRLDKALERVKELEAALLGLLNISPVINEALYVDRGVGTKTTIGIAILNARAALSKGQK